MVPREEREENITKYYIFAQKQNYLKNNLKVNFEKSKIVFEFVTT